MSHSLDRIARFAKSAPVNIEAAIREFGIGLTKNAALPEGIAGHIKQVEGDKYEIATTSADHYFRQRFTMAHELGHYILHRSLIGAGVDDDIKYRSTENGEFYNEFIDIVHERQANSFAANFLLPEGLVRSEVATLGAARVKDLARKFQVSPSAMRWRLTNLGIAPVEG